MEDGSQIINLPNDEYERIFGEISPKIKAYFSNAQKPKTNADRIRSMSDEELAGFLFEYGGSAPNCKDEIVSNCKSCRDCWLDWLKQEAKE